MSSHKLLRYGGIAAGVVLILFGVGAIVLSVQGKNTVTDSLKNEKIVGSLEPLTETKQE